MDWLPASLQDLIYLGLFIGPFVQEDAAVLAAATLSVNGTRPTLLIYLVILAGLIASDLWKYWIGWAALRYPKARAFAERKHAVDLGDKVNRHLALTLIAARFVPLSRIPAYIACGFFKVSYWRYCLYISFTAFLYVSAVFLVCHLLGEVMGEKLRWLIPIVGFSFLIGYLGYRYVRARNNSDAMETDTPPEN